ncbi:uncharacterized protein [Phaseolus vulgaris]|uniref:uncharacterized protein n=1 Tax=Phaseolus vulgaris TaxID=3885 RepID=UPI0035CC4FA4
MEELMNYVHQHGLFEGDYGIHFTTDEVFPLREDLLEWVRRVGYGLGFVIVIIRSDIANGRLKTNEHSMLVDMTKSMVKSGNILRTLKENNEDNMTTIKQIYNARYSYKRSVRGPRTELQQLMMLLDRDNYLHWSTCHESSNIVSDIFWTHPDAVKLLNAFNIVFLMDTTYKTNKYRLPLLEIVGVTCTGLSFFAGFAFLSSDKEKNFIWALQKFRGSLLTSHVGPEVIVCDRDLALMNAINIVFPKTRNLLCRFHINKNVKAKCKMLVDSVEAWEVVMDSWKTIIDCTEIEFDRVNDVGFDSERCGCVLRQTHGLPCACQLASSSSLKTCKGKVKVMTNTNAIPMLDQFHPKCHPYILDVMDVKAYGHCGFRAIASLLGMGEESWPLIRMDLFKEISQWREEYATLLGGHQRVEDIKRSLLVDELSVASVEKWMTIPGKVKLLDDCPIPTADILWCTHCYPEARLWSSYYIARMQSFTQLISISPTYVNLGDD